MSIPTSHPRYLSLLIRDRITAGVAAGITSPHGLIAHGRGEAYDYLLGEQTHPFAHRAIQAAAALLRIAQHPVLSINGNVCALCPTEMVSLSTFTHAPLEINIFHTSAERERRMQDHLVQAGAPQVLMPSKTHTLPHLDHNRRYIHPDGIARADVVFVPLEDGDRCAALVTSGRRVITIDLNPLSRTSRTATITIVDNIIRAIPHLITAWHAQSSHTPAQLAKILTTYDNQATLREAQATLRQNT